MIYTIVTLHQHHSLLMAGEINRRLGPSRAVAISGDLNSILHDRHNLSGDALITPGNSYGDMSGGFDLAVRDYYGPKIEMAVQNEIVSNYRGEIPVGSAFVLPLPSPASDVPRAFQTLVYAPVMRIPKRLHPESDAVYNSILASLQAIHQWNDARMRAPFMPYLDHVWLTCHGVGTGGLSIEYVAKQTAMAISQYENNFILGQHDCVAWDREITRGQ
jgi:O-acetyl-ADP-ribose deacetylase (regulator of RNase III)